jgi:hypothetical protein
MMRWDYLRHLSSSALLDLHKAIQRALQEDDKLPTRQKEYGVREFPDFRQEADEIETELDNRREPYSKIAW